MSPVKILQLLGDALSKLLEVKQGGGEKYLPKAMELFQLSNPKLLRWVHELTKDPASPCCRRGSEECPCETYEKLYTDLVQMAAPFQTGGEFAHLSTVGDSTVYQGLKLGIEALRREAAAKKIYTFDPPPRWKHPTWEPAMSPLLKDGDLGRIANFARASHAGQMGKYADYNEPYIRHVERVVRRCEGDDNAKAVAWLHDVVEDCNVSLEELARLVQPHIVYAVGLLTRPKAPHNYLAHIESIRDSKNALAIKVKIADLQDHLRHNSLPAWKRARYTTALNMLCKG